MSSHLPVLPVFLLILSLAHLAFGQSAAPVITRISPDTVAATGPSFTLTVDGSGFQPGMEVVLGGHLFLATNYVSPTQLTTVVPDFWIRNPTTYQVAVQTSPGTPSNSLALAVVAPVPVITSIFPATVKAGISWSTDLTVKGSGFLSTATVHFNGEPLLTLTPSSPATLQASIPAELVAKPGPAVITHLTL